MKNSAAQLSAASAIQYRPLLNHERVQRGDFVADGRQGFEPWAGPAGFRADAYVKQIYRVAGRRRENRHGHACPARTIQN